MSLKSKALKASLKYAKRWYKSPHKDIISKVRGVKTEAKFKFKQKSKPGGGTEINPQQLSYGIGSKEHKISQKLISIAARRPAYKGAHHLDESWRSEMNRLFGGIHMSQDPKLVKKSIKVLAKKLKKKKIKKATEGGEVVVHANVDRSLL